MSKLPFVHGLLITTSNQNTLFQDFEKNSELNIFARS